jgi:hypothetical protein
MSEASSYITGGDFQNTPPSFPSNILESDSKGARIALPNDPGLYRVYVTVSDGQGGAATANLPIQVQAEKIDAGPAMELPYAVYDEASKASEFFSSGWMGNTDAVRMDHASTENPHSGETCIRCEYDASSGWAGVVWQDPEKDWGEKPGGKNFTGAKSLTFWARGNSGNEKLKVGFGLLGNDKPYYDTTKKEELITLSKEWKEYTIDLSNADLQRIKSPFLWVVEGQGEPLIFYFDDIVIR